MKIDERFEKIAKDVELAHYCGQHQIRLSHRVAAALQQVANPLEAKIKRATKMLKQFPGKEWSDECIAKTIEILEGVMK